VIVVGAGTAGSITAKTAAKAGLKVCLIDSKKSEEIGDKVCGDAIGKHHFDTLKLAYPKGEELRTKIAGVKIHSPDMNSIFQITGEKLYGFILNRRSFGQRLLHDAIDAGSTLFDSSIVTEPVLKEGFVTGVIAKDTRTTSKTQLQGKVVVDASGFMAVLRKKLPPQIGVDLDVENQDVEACHREIRELKGLDVNPEFCEIFLDMTVAPAGYYWIFPEGENRVNVGLGVAMSEGFPSPKSQLYEKVLSKPMFEGSKVVTQGTWYVPTRRPLDCMAGNGILAVGDAACQVNPIHGGGMGPSMMGGTIAGQTIVEAVENGDVSRRGLWQYNVKYMRVYGAKQAGLDIFRLFLLKSVGNEEINYGMKYKLITEEDVLKVSMGQSLRLNITEKTKRAFRGFGKFAMLRRLRDAANLLKKTKTMYENYPYSPEDFEDWRKKIHAIMETANKSLSRSRS
jgi:geranylgeranyl reductase family protein